MAEDLARSSGTPDDVIKLVLSQDFLLKCLRKSKFSADLLQDTSDACEINDLNALVLGSGLLSITEASEKLFLMQDEASTVVSVCRKECLRAGVNFGDGAKLSPEELAESDIDEPAAPAPAPPAVTAPPAPPAPAQPAPPSQPSVKIPPASAHPSHSRTPSGTQDNKLPKAPSKLASAAPASITPAPAQRSSQTSIPAMSPTAWIVEVAPKQVEPTPQRSSLTNGEHPDPNFLIKPPVAVIATPGTAPAHATPSSVRSHIPKPGNLTPSTPAVATGTPRGGFARGIPRATPSATPTSSSGGAYEPGSRGAVATPSANGKYTPAASNSSAKPPRPSSAPLTARASTTAPLGRDRPVSALPSTVMVTPPAQITKLPSYAKPTASHKARLVKEDSDIPSTSATPPLTFASTSKPLRRLLYVPPRGMSTTPEDKKEPKKPIFDNIRSNLLRPTAAFLAWSSGKSKPAKEGDLRASQNLQLKLTTTPEPFRLASAERHQKAQEELAKKKEEKARLESQIPKFKASPMPPSAERSVTSAKSTQSRRSSTPQPE